jgi:predicted cytidylate kinase
MARRITISGLPGSGTSSLCTRLAELTGWEYINAGQIFRDLAAELGVSLVDLGQRAEADGDIDRQLDERMTRQASDVDGCVLEGRITGWMLQRHGVEAFKVWVHADIHTRARRVAGRDAQSFEEATAAILEREQSEHLRYAAHHDIDLSDLSVYDLVVNSDEADAESLARQVVDAHAEAGGG